MPTPSTNSGIRDNHRRGNVADFLKAKLQTGSRLSVVSAYFTIYAYEALKDQLNKIEHLERTCASRLLVTFVVKKPCL